MERNRSKKAKSLRAAGSSVKAKSLVHQSDVENRVILRSSLAPPTRQFARKEVHVRRFVQNAAVSNVAFTLANGHDQFLVVQNNLGSANPFVDAWRIKSIDVWAISTSNVPCSVQISPTGTDLTSNMNNDPEKIFECSSRSASLPAHMKILASKFRPLGAWHFTTTTNVAGTLFVMSVGTLGGTVQNVTMDITFEVMLNWVGFPLGYTVNTSTTTLGTIGGRNVLNGFQLIGINNLG